MNSGATRELVVLAADKNAEAAIQGILARHQSLAIGQVDAQIFVHPNRDAGCLNEAHDFLRPFTRQYRQAIVIMDFQGCGRERLTPEQIEQDMENELSRSGWEQRAAAIVIAPELEAWVWNASRELERIVRWNNELDIYSWLRQENLLEQGQVKPPQPKEALERILRLLHRPRTSSLFRQLAENVSLRNCIDRAFVKLKNTLQQWFPV